MGIESITYDRLVDLFDYLQSTQMLYNAPATGGSRPNKNLEDGWMVYSVVVKSLLPIPPHVQILLDKICVQIRHAASTGRVLAAFQAYDTHNLGFVSRVQFKYVLKVSNPSRSMTS